MPRVPMLLFMSAQFSGGAANLQFTRIWHPTWPCLSRERHDLTTRFLLEQSSQNERPRRGQVGLGGSGRDMDEAGGPRFGRPLKMGPGTDRV